MPLDIKGNLLPLPIIKPTSTREALRRTNPRPNTPNQLPKRTIHKANEKPK